MGLKLHRKCSLMVWHHIQPFAGENEKFENKCHPTAEVGIAKAKCTIKILRNALSSPDFTHFSIQVVWAPY